MPVCAAVNRKTHSIRKSCISARTHDYIRVLYIDLEKEKVRIDERQDLTQYLGGVGVASKLLEENMRPDLDPLY